MIIIIIIIITIIMIMIMIIIIIIIIIVIIICTSDTTEPVSELSRCSQKTTTPLSTLSLFYLNLIDNVIGRVNFRTFLQPWSKHLGTVMKIKSENALLKWNSELTS